MLKKYIQRYTHDVIIALEAIMSNKMKSILTALGIIFGVAAVISMLAIGNGARQEILDQIKMVGVNNIVINPTTPQTSDDEASDKNEKQTQKYSPGLTLADAEAIKELVPGVKYMSPEVTVNSFIQQSGLRYSSKIKGVSIDYFELYNLPLAKGGYFNAYQAEHGIPVCVIGHNIAAKFFNQVDPIGKNIKFGPIWLQVIGVLKKTNLTVSSFENAGVSVYNDNVFIPIKTMLIRFQNRAVAKTMRGQGSSMVFYSSGRMNVRYSGNEGAEERNYNQLDKIIIQVQETDLLQPTTEVLSRMMLRRHQEVKDFEITVPELLLKQQQRTKDIFNIVLGAIAGISLLVGGIGIMNIMYASVMQRIKEIGTRLAIGAKKADIIAQFLSEAVLISIVGGVIGVILGIVLSKVITYFFDIKTIISFTSILLSFGVSAAVGVIFGYSPAKGAADKDPIESLRYE